MPQSKKFKANAGACARIALNGWKEGVTIYHASTGVAVVLGTREKDGAWWGMTKQTPAKKGKIRPIDMIRDYQSNPVEKQ